jgi:oxygen-independent coproporphyrinogen-3 oxidase
VLRLQVGEGAQYSEFQNSDIEFYLPSCGKVVAELRPGFLDQQIAMNTHELLDKYNRPGPRYTSYPTALKFDDSFTANSYLPRLELADSVDAPLSVYLHLPFCQNRCLFCACNVIISPDKTRVVDYLDLIKHEFAMVASRIPNRRGISQLHIGGGTPTYFTPEQLKGVLEELFSHFHLLPGAEVGLEVDPRVTRREHLEVVAQFGFNRLSMGVQDFDAVVQRAVNRVQSVAETIAVIDAGRELGMDSINIDLIYGLPSQSIDGFSRTLDEVIDIAPDRLAVYSFAFVPWIKGLQQKVSDIPSPELKYQLWSLSREKLMGAGYHEIGMDHFSKPTDELTIAQNNGTLGRNFMGYTTTRAPDMLGFGISSIGYVAGGFVQNVKKLSSYRTAILAEQLPVGKGYLLTDDDKIRQHVISELMCNLVLDKHKVEARFGIDFDRYFATALQGLTPLQDDGLVLNKADEIRVTEAGKLFVRNIAMPFDMYLQIPTTTQPMYSQTI